MRAGVLLAAGGTGGHMVPADALSAELCRRGHRVALVTDERGLRFPGLFLGVERHVVPAATLAPSRPWGWPRGLITIGRGRRAARRLIRSKALGAVVGFGGYPSFPALLAGQAERVPTILHEQNAVVGRANRLLARRAALLALGFAETARLPSGCRAVHVGNPVRDEVLHHRDAPFRPPPADAPFRLLVVGGSQGARVFSELLPLALAGLAPAKRARLVVAHQARPEDLERAEAAYRAAGIAAECVPYWVDLPARMADAHLVVARAGASTLAELTAMGRPAILIPYPAATDDHQWANARPFAAAGAGVVVREADATPARVAGLIEGFLASPEALATAAAAARSLGVPDAARRLADLIEAQLEGAAR
ncbi:MAG: UDP-N-acetylglucosamine--N-acetylmuramyl-(pentapeptide) pyrophosphoryl-undecaprenol N-acetylglucosamine transferase [Sphingomonadaceae bacterium]|uniref:UDP-N-acetylglucosamine--N-acetylmuramyl- (pentapeptide) pyrophosphoryl-undecaprenol N-acetylglucosamine transferase n=1 Tax=Thermaurantiacus sp. TaxID=2820283 RepID=UPI00298F23BB|nr:UDP-N-acetylglucosamine--N-acetylmuramyl-(pentapeptide) pyrophosphoryl-undecaprenol N-acetylglucosamine transferase [Thermaurantiacus sp.]MCS6986918.1 UDP-N-acetylglucosamine--N-acetylmuramyl-(pentapeptide) pyrophosphoryl-undecaprenol N-acetylglucosamine transferase [Sphingomonadaceae bacterium]MDW8415482.1 UDP-N-acetylglucosamine--N-acetylmuramyl-(pentapeptide) pyrophosphoryl-undecaprenol N-acetylglucosamine transferase [Thermaurantiacus sp.]